MKSRLLFATITLVLLLAVLTGIAIVMNSASPPALAAPTQYAIRTTYYVSRVRRYFHRRWCAVGP